MVWGFGNIRHVISKVGARLIKHTPNMAAAMALQLPWCPPPSTAAYNN